MIKSDAFLTKARAFLDRVPLVDGHNDMPYVLRVDSSAKGDIAAYNLANRHPETDTDIPRLIEGKVSGQFWAAYCPTNVESPAAFTLELIAMIRAIHKRHADVFLPATRPSDVAKAKRLGKIASFIGVESGVGLGDRLELLEVFHDLGVRYMTLCHNESLPWVDSATDAPRCNGLSSFGESVIQRMNELGLLIDLSHTSEPAQHRVLDLTTAPVAITHSNARALNDHPRNTTDAIIRRLKDNGGIIMATFVPTFTSQAVRDWMKPIQIHDKHPSDGSWPQRVADRTRQIGPCPKATMAEFCDHVDHLARVAGINHVGIGSDFYGGPAIDGIEDVSKFPHVIAALMERGWSEPNLAKLVSRNFLRVLRQVQKQAI
jgi:membrane dipeptidase